MRGSHLCSQLGHNDRKICGCSRSSVANSVAHSTACVIYILFNNIHMSHATQKPENYEEILENLAVFYPILPGAVLRDTAKRTSYEAIADVIRVRCGGVTEGGVVKDRVIKQANK